MSTLHRSHAWKGILLFILLFAAQVYAQTVTGTLMGHVADKTGAVVPNAKILVINTSTGAGRETVSNEAGYYLVSFLPLGNYDVTVSSPGFRAVKKTGVLIELNNNTVSDFALDVAGTSTEVEVKGGEIPLIDTTTGEIKTSLDAQQVANTPIAGRNFMSLVEQVPGFQPAAFNTSSNNPTNSTGSYASFSGQGTRSTTFQVDGVNNDDSSENQNRNNVNPATIKEFQVLTNGYAAEFGRAGGAVVLVQTKSGSNGYHGEAYDYIQNDIFNANGWFNKLSGGQRGPVRRNNYGGTIGGPVFKDKLFFFGSGDRIAQVGKASMSRFTWLPTDTPHACAPGEISKPGGPYCVDPATHPNMQRDLDFMKKVMALWDTPELKGKTPNDTLSCAQLIATGRPNRCVLVGGLGFSNPRSDYTGRMDWVTSTSTNMNIRYQYSRQQDISPRLVLGDNYGTNNNRQYNIGYTATHVFSPRQTGEFRYGFGNRNTNQQVTDSNDIPIIRFGTTLTNPAASSTYLGIGGTVIGTSANVPILRKQRDHQLVYNHTLVLGTHTLRAGIDQRFSALDDVASGTQRGYWQFYGGPFTTAQQTAKITDPNSGFIGWELFLMGIVGGTYPTNGSGFQKGFGQPYAQNRFNETNIYLQDSWRVTPELTLNLGARWEGVGAPHEIKNRFNYGYGGDYNNLEPRIGFAWSPKPSEGLLAKITGSNPGDFVIRGGYGMYHDRVFQSIFSQSGLNFRYQPPNGYFLGNYPKVCATNPGGNVVAPAGTFAFDGAQFEISDPTCGFAFTPGMANYSLAASGGGVKVAGGRLLTSLMLPDKNFQMPYVHQWNLTVERKLPWSMALQLGYNGNRGIGLPFFSGINDALFGAASPVVTADVGGGNYQPVVFDRVCSDFTDTVCNNYNAAGVLQTGSSGSLRRFADLTATTATYYGATHAATLADKGIVVVNGVPHGYITINTPRLDERRPDPAMMRNVRLSNFAWTYYNSMVVRLTKTTTHGFNFNSWFTWSRTEDTGSETTVTNTDLAASSSSKNAALLKALSSFHQKYRFSLSGSYTLPWMKNQQGVIGRIVGGWNVSSVLTIASGLPFSMWAGYDTNLDGVAGDRPVIVDKSVIGRSVSNGHQLNPCPVALVSGRCIETISETAVPISAFLPTNSSVGNAIPLFPGVDMPAGTVQRNSFFEDGQKNVDMAVDKTIHIVERVNVNLRFELYNVFNRPTFGIPANSVWTNGTTPLGRISGTYNLQNYVNSAANASGARMGQLALRVIW